MDTKKRGIWGEETFHILRGISWPKFKLLVKISRENNTWLIDGCGSINIPNSIIIQSSVCIQ